ncbi:hybrid sensor histidine kinase/response regulator [Pedobacter psychrophilus]|uniref:histidine kinase n=1 Tax=Pedobacter psychrophilus TaxID=1826909 RepID=A0A179DB18_9SPHI|nr:ATP-binding protein [Pedobacter psychrophilus]OAQ38114.1 hybrid sensor histidine kinase/response regulator [Pedobacter psychrophilus]
MFKNNQQVFFRIIKGKIIIAFTLAFLSLAAAWGVSKFVFEKMLNKVEQISLPNDKLRIVNDLFNKISRLDQQQRELAINDTGNYRDFFKTTRKLKSGLDTLGALYQLDSIQLIRIKSIKKLLSERDQQFLKYLKVRESLVNTKSFSDEVNKLNNLVNTKAWKADSTIYTTETKTSTTTLSPNDNKKGFLNRLFSKKKDEGFKVVSEELKIKKDTLNTFIEDNILSDMESSLKSIEIGQRVKSKKFIQQESSLSDATNKLTSKMLIILEEVKNEVLVQMNYNGLEAKKVVNDGIIQITAILIAFLIITILLLYFILSDITKSNKYRKALEVAKEEAEYYGKEKQRFLANMSHEIRTPLQSIIGYTEQIALQKIPNKNNINAIQSSSNHLLHIVNEILDYSRIISAEFNIRNEVFNIDAYIKEVIEVLKPLAESKSIIINSEINCPANYQVIGDGFRLKQILFNLIGNAIKFSEHSNIELLVNFKEDKKNIHFNFIIKDYGIGISEDNLNKIFNEFEQIENHNQTNLNHNGTGLGLSIVKKLVEIQNGRINVKSKINEGSTFYVYLQYQQTSQQIINKKINNSPNFNKKFTVWIVDDDQLILDLIGLIFTDHNLNYKCFNRPEDILNQDIDDGLKYILIDMRMPKYSGIEICQMLKNKLPHHIKYYAITAQVLPNERDSILNSGFDGIIMKPFKSADLLQIFQNHQAKENIEINLDQLKKMTFGDQNQLEKILKSFISNCKEDITLLKNAVINSDKDEVRLIVHRLAGRISQMGAKKVAVEFRKMEIEIEGSDGISKQIKSKINELLTQLETLITVLEANNYSIP